MVAGKVKAAVGFHRSSATPKAEATCRSSSTSASRKPSPGTTGHRAPPTPLPSFNPKTAAAFARSFGVYFPRTNAQVQPRPPEVAELLRLVEELQEKESLLRTQLLEQKLLQETVAIVPFLEKEIADKTDELSQTHDRIGRLEVENCALRDEVAGLSSKLRSSEEESKRREKKIAELEAESDKLRKAALEQSHRESRALAEGVVEDCSSSQQFQGFIDASARSNLLRSLRKAPKCVDTVGPNQDAQTSKRGDAKADEAETQGAHQQPRGLDKDDVLKLRIARVPKPPPMPNNVSASSSSSFLSETPFGGTMSKSVKLAGLPPIPPAAPHAGPSPNDGGRLLPPPPPPPPPSRGFRPASTCVKRVPEVVEFYHSLMRRDTKKESSGGGPEAATISVASNTRNMIGEIENRSAHLLAIKTDVETQGEFIRFLIREVEHAVFNNIEDVVAFVKWLDDELAFLVDERAVLKHFEWPEQKADAMREAAFGYCDLKKLESEASSFRDDSRQPYACALKKMQALLEKLEQAVYNLSRVRDNATKRYKGFGIPCEWMQDCGYLSQIKLASVKLAMKYMKRVSTELEIIAGSPDEEELMLQGVRFAFRVHQFASGFDVETMRAFQELKDKANTLHLQRQNQNQQVFCRSTSCQDLQPSDQSCKVGSI
ncbi:protein CHUP1, chloroplastic-like isoform X1 [Zingiber officinale]|uniref:protein CHUP1, chloroplastic-like isoform X1 n=1 Tax=Zingiber officinale TaxID=94328 RepID=UPI001C4AE87F|nr:protein CHUP1, chloroplastic-like isoform X1 [Zingiber officinale]